jgi:hypothetical protein
MGYCRRKRGGVKMTFLEVYTLLLVVITAISIPQMLKEYDRIKEEAK